MASLITKSVKGTQKIARELGESLKPGQVIALVGSLGAGKTSFVQGLAEGLQIHDLRQVLSPSYALINEYPGARVPLVHVDLYRLTDSASARALGVEEAILRGDAVVAVEWADHLPDLIPPDALWVYLSHVGKNHRPCRLVLPNSFA